jgi:sensor c-di-GMP phosphodiesterase-like protein
MVNAEGVETSSQAEVLRLLGCSEGQGFLYSRPISGEQFEALVCQAEHVQAVQCPPPEGSAVSEPAVAAGEPV